MTRAEFIDRFGGVYEHSPWVAKRAWAQFKNREVSLSALRPIMAAIVNEAREADQLMLINAHPDLAGRAAIAGTLTEASRTEQQGAGLDRCTPAEYAEFQELNAAYKNKFGFPFIIAVTGLNRVEILEHSADVVLTELVRSLQPL